MRITCIIFLMIFSQIGKAQVPATEADDFIKNLEAAHYFKYVQHKKDIKVWKQIVRKSLTDYGWLSFPQQGWITEVSTGKNPGGEEVSFDFRTFQVDGSSLFRGGLMSYLNTAKQFFKARGLKFDFRDEKTVWGEKDDARDYHYFKHTVIINDRLTVIADGNLNRMGGDTYVKKLVEIISAELKQQGSADHIELLNWEDGVVLLWIDDPLKSVYAKIPAGWNNKLLKK